ncbi:RNase3 domain protein [Aspergillus ibericus CBS 121593]|uniref:RNase3 domain protein n=1 Tax=Aspergillus ibericus CBS 121593 TaxID=1448316 RepID=A0A395GJ92_9EURO|nr:RNase3 domain protein [Aspergillus ibericus CBS 121593]RAK95352.1 RNase3 domain protein [Aspergillus ibericus CBS 121593]
MSHLEQIESITGYRFRNENCLLEALKAAGADERNHDGNRPLAQVGKAFVELCSVKFGYLSRTERSMNTMMKIKNIDNNRCALLAKSIGIDQLVTYCPLPGSRSAKVLGIAVNALIGAIYVDSESEDLTVSALHSMGWFRFSLEENSSSNTVNSQCGSMGVPAESQASNDLAGQVPIHAMVRQQTTKQKDNTLFTTFLKLEMERCALHQIPSPQETYFNARLQNELSELQARNPTFSHDLGMLFLTFAGPQSVAGLQANLHGALAAVKPPDEIYHIRASIEQRFNIIRTLDELACHFDILKNYHIWKLHVHCTEQGEDSRFCIAYGDPEYRKRPGNPVNLKESDTTKKMIDIICPETEPTSAYYRVFYEKVTCLRRRGKRLQLLIETFGLGILGLMYCHSLQNCSSRTSSVLL